MNVPTFVGGLHGELVQFPMLDIIVCVFNLFYGAIKTGSNFRSKFVIKQTVPCSSSRTQ